MERKRAFELRARRPIDFEAGWHAGRDYSEPEPEMPCVMCDTTAELPSGDCAQCAVREAEERERALREALDNLAEAIERVSYKGEAGDVEDLDDARREAVAALATPPGQQNAGGES